MEKRRRTTAAGVVLCLVLAGCGWRLDTPDPSPLEPNATETLRDTAARAEADLVASLDSAVPGGPGSEWLIRFESHAAPIHLDALGGVYEPYPPPSSESPSDIDPGFGPTSYSGHAALARDIALEGALTAENPHLALLLASIGLSHAAALRIQAETDARIGGFEVPRIANRLLPPSGGDPAAQAVPTAGTSVPPDTLLDLILLHDQAVYVCEVVAARAEGDLRWIAYQRSLLHEARADALTALAGSDPRGPSYATDRTTLQSNETMETLLRHLEAEVATAYVAAFADVASGEGTDRSWLLSGAFDALVASLNLGTEPGEASAFPGIAVPGLAGFEPSPGV